MAWQSILDRFRPLGAPGPAAAAGVPSQDVTGPAAELAPVLARLRGDVEAAEAQVAEARADADRLVARARDGAAAILADARARAPGVRADAAARAEQQAAEQRSRWLEAARAESEALAARAEQRMPTLVTRALDRVLDEQGAGRRSR